jgi:glycosyltransferase involved in cell wall biosynthesis
MKRANVFGKNSLFDYYCSLAYIHKKSMKKDMTRLKIAMIAPPWLPVPPVGYGGTENVIYHLSEELRKLGHKVELFTVGESKAKTKHNHWVYAKAQYHHIHQPFYYSAVIPISHIFCALRQIKKAKDFDIIHDHNKFIGPAMMSADKDLPPVLHTLHDPFVDREQVKQGIPDDHDMYDCLKSDDELHFNCISKAQIKHAPHVIRKKIAGYIYNSIDVKNYPIASRKGNYFITISRISRHKGQATAAQIAVSLGLKYKIAGIVADISTPRQIMLELANPQSSYRLNPDFKYYSDEILPLLKQGSIEYIGSVFGKKKLSLLSKAQGFLFPIDWEEPFGVAVVEALACGTPVVAFKRGSMPEIIEHGVNGFLASNTRQFKEYVRRVGEIDPAKCRESVEMKFSAEKMASAYIDVYKRILSS